MRNSLLAALLAVAACGAWPQEENGIASLAKEVANRGWIAYSARSANGSWDLFRMRPDGSQVIQITDTPGFEEAAPRFDPGGKRVLFRAIPRGAIIDHDRWGFQGSLIIAGVNGEDPQVLGEDGAYPWASWSPDGRQVACLDQSAILIINVATGRVARQMPRNSIYQQLFWSPNGKWLCGVANHRGASWTVVRVDAMTGETNPVRTLQNCTPDWFPDSFNVIFSSRPAGQSGAGGYGYTQLWRGRGDGAEADLVFGEDGYHIYGGALSPDGKYVLFTQGLEDGAGSEKEGAPICLIRLRDTPSIAGPSTELRALHPYTKDGPVLVIGFGWEPHWTDTELAAPG